MRPPTVGEWLALQAEADNVVARLLSAVAAEKVQSIVAILAAIRTVAVLAADAGVPRAELTRLVAEVARETYGIKEKN